MTGRPSIQLDVGGARRQADYVGPIGEATDALEFSYVVQSGDFDADGVTLCASGPGCGSIQLDGGSVRSTADEADANLVLPALAAQSGHKVDAAEPLPMRPTACTAEVGVPSDWALKPSGVTTGGKFRLLFITSASYNATSRDIDHYNRLVQARAAAGHASIRDYSTGFRVVGSTASVDARDNTCTTGTGALIHWLAATKPPTATQISTTNRGTTKQVDAMRTGEAWRMASRGSGLVPLMMGPDSAAKSWEHHRS